MGSGSPLADAPGSSLRYKYCNWRNRLLVESACNTQRRAAFPHLVHVFAMSIAEPGTVLGARL